jgi:hypothetical protein
MQQGAPSLIIIDKGRPECTFALYWLIWGAANYLKLKRLCDWYW